MSYSRALTPTITLLVSIAAAQTPAPRPPAAWDYDSAAPAPKPARLPRPAWDAPTPPPAPRALFAPQVGIPPAAPTPEAAPMPVPVHAPEAVPVPPAPPAFFEWDGPQAPNSPQPVRVPKPPQPPRFDFDFHVDFDDQKWELEHKLRDVQIKLENMDVEGVTRKALADAEVGWAQAEKALANVNVNVNVDEIRSKAYAMADHYRSFGPKFGFAAQLSPQARRNQSDDRAYENGQRAVENHRYAEALEDFNLVASRGGSRADSAWYWKAYTLNKLGRRDEALAAIAELRKAYASSRWLDDAKALEVEVRQSTGQPVKPESEADDELKLLALNGLMQSDPERAFPLLENLLKSAQSPKLRRNAVYVLASSPQPRAQQLLEQIARGGGNPDLQMHAIRRLGDRRRPNDGQMLGEIYASSTDNAVKRATLNALQNLRDKDRLLQIAKTEKTQELRWEAIRMFKDAGGAQAELWLLYQTETSPEAKQQILEMIPPQGNTDKLTDLARNEKDVKLRRMAIQRLGNERSASSGDALIAIYTAEQDQDVKRSVIESLGNQKNVKALVAVARAEQDSRMKQRIVERLVNMRSPEATEYLLELLK